MIFFGFFTLWGSLFRSIPRSFKVKYEHNNVVIEAEQNSDTQKDYKKFLYIARFKLIVPISRFLRISRLGFNRPFSATLRIIEPKPYHNA